MGLWFQRSSPWVIGLSCWACGKAHVVAGVVVESYLPHGSWEAKSNGMGKDPTFLSRALPCDLISTRCSALPRGSVLPQHHHRLVARSVARGLWGTLANHRTRSTFRGENLISFLTSKSGRLLTYKPWLLCWKSEVVCCPVRHAYIC